MKRLFALGLPLLLAGCVLPPAVTIATSAITGFSYLATGKGVGDHAISQMSQRDCALHRIFTQGAACNDPAAQIGPTLALGSGAPPTATDSDASAPITLASRAPRPSLEMIYGPPVGRPGDAEPAIVPASVDPDAGPATVPRPARAAVTVLVIGSYRQRIHAEQLIAAQAALEPTIVPALVNGERHYRVVTHATTDDVSAAGLADMWPLRLPPESAGAGGFDDSIAASVP